MKIKNDFYVLVVVAIVAIIGISIMTINSINTGVEEKFTTSAVADTYGQSIFSWFSRSPQTKIDYTPRIAYWSGKVNEHINTATGLWETDPDGVSNSSINKLTYCQKWYPNTTRVMSYRTEKIIGWKNLNNDTYYNATKHSYRCVSYKPQTYFQNCTPNADSVTCAGATCGMKLNNCRQAISCGTCAAGQRCIHGQCNATTPTTPVVCTTDAKLCSDGSYVSRTGPNCEFAPCPAMTCTCPDGYIKEGDVCNPSCYTATPPCLTPSVQCTPSTPTCTPLSSAAACNGKTCGSASDGCGGTVACGICASGQECTNGICASPTQVCSDTCTSKGFQCGVQNVCDTNVDCGICGATQTCNISKCVAVVIVPTCTAETDVAFCSRLGKACGGVTANDNCGNSRTVSNCGTCGTGKACSTAGACVTTCTAETDTAFCSRLGKTCGSVTANDNCGTSRTVSSCGTCTSAQTCTANKCVAVSTSIACDQTTCVTAAQVAADTSKCLYIVKSTTYGNWVYKASNSYSHHGCTCGTDRSSDPYHSLSFIQSYKCAPLC